MQARKLSLAEAHPSQVVKVEVDAASQSVAILLRDSSCLLFPSLSGTSPSLLIPPSCTDICFLRFRQRNSTHISSSSSSDKSAELTSRSDLRKLANAKSKTPMAAPERIGDVLPRVTSVGDVTTGSVSEALLFLALKPAKGVVCTDLMAWRCCESGFFQTSIFLEGLLDGHSSASIARLDGIPHGISAGITASVNVVVVHSPVVGKLWIFSAKYSKGEHYTTKSDGIESGHIHVLNNAVKDATTLVKDNHEKENHGCLQLFKCAAVDCNGPVYTMHLSLQHLLVGQLGGVRVWLLRPLIKGSAAARKDSKAAHHLRRCAGAKQERNKILEDQDCGKKIMDIHRSSNGHHSSAFDGIGTARTSRGLCHHVVAVPKNGFHEMSVLQCDGTKIVRTYGFSSLEGNTNCKKQGCGCSGKPSEDDFSPSNGCSKQDMNSDVLHDSVSNAPKLVQFHEAIMPAYRNGTSFELDTEEAKSQQKLSQFSMFSSSSDSSSSLPIPYSTCVRSASCHSSNSSLSSVVGASGTTGGYHKADAGKGAQAGVFVCLQKNQTSLSTSSSHANAEQVTGIHGISEKDFVVLDSHGKLHLLNLQYLARGDEARLQAPRILLNASLQPLACGINIKFLTVLPDLNSNKKNSDLASRVLWVSDGCYTVYIVEVRAGESSKEASGKPYLMSKSNLTVIGTVFLTEHALLLSALHENAVMVLTEGSMVAYSSTGA